MIRYVPSGSYLARLRVNGNLIRKSLKAFVDWMKEKHADEPTLREVTREFAEKYASSLNHGKFSASTYNKHLNLLTLVFRVVKNKAELASNPWEDK